MKTNTTITVELNDIIAQASVGSKFILSSYVRDCSDNLIPQTGVYYKTYVRVCVPYLEKDKMVAFTSVTLPVLVRIKGGLNYIYRYKIELPDSDPFEGNADENPLAGQAIWEFYENMRCAADELKKRGTMAFYK